MMCGHVCRPDGGRLTAVDVCSNSVFDIDIAPIAKSIARTNCQFFICVVYLLTMDLLLSSRLVVLEMICLEATTTLGLYISANAVPMWGLQGPISCMNRFPRNGGWTAT